MDLRDASHRQRSRSMRLVAAVALSVLLATGGWWCTHPRAFLEGGDRAGAQAMIGESVVFGHVVSPHRIVEITSIRVHGATGRARVRFFACRKGSVGVLRGTAEDVCADLRPLDRVKFGPDPVAHQWTVVAEIILLEGDSFTARGFEVGYRDGIRRGRQVSGLWIAVYTRDRAPDWLSQ